MTDVEDRLRDTLHRLADRAPEPGGQRTADRVRARHRRELRTRRAVLAVAAATLLAVALPAGAQLTGSGGGPATQAVPAPFTRSVPGNGPATATIAPEDPGMYLQGGPVHPQVGVAYPFDLYTHCGISVTQFGGRSWRAVDPAPDPQRRPGPDGTTHHDGYVHGKAELVTPDRMRFTVTDPSVDVQGRSYEFTPIAMAEFPLCD